MMACAVLGGIISRLAIRAMCAVLVWAASCKLHSPVEVQRTMDAPTLYAHFRDVASMGTCCVCQETIMHLTGKVLPINWSTTNVVSSESIENLGTFSNQTLVCGSLILMRRKIFFLRRRVSWVTLQGLYMSVPSTRLFHFGLIELVSMRLKQAPVSRRHPVGIGVWAWKCIMMKS